METIILDLVFGLLLCKALHSFLHALESKESNEENRKRVHDHLVVLEVTDLGNEVVHRLLAEQELHQAAAVGNGVKG